MKNITTGWFKVNAVLALILVLFISLPSASFARNSLGGLGSKLKSSAIGAGGCSEESSCASSSCRGIRECAAGVSASACEAVRNAKCSLDSLFSGIADFFKDLLGAFSRFFGGLRGLFSGECQSRPPENATEPQRQDNNCGPNVSEAPPADGASTTGAADGASTTGAADGEKIQSDSPSASSATVDTSSAESLAKGIKEKFGITLENASSSWDMATMKKVNDLLGKLPSEFTGFTKQIQRIGASNLGAYVGGYVSSDAPRVYMTDWGAKIDPAGVLAHEMGHNFHFANRSVMNAWQSQFWGGRNAYGGSYGQKSQSVSSYGNTNPMEDFAESVKHYILFPAQMKSQNPERYQFIKNNVMKGKEF